MSKKIGRASVIRVSLALLVAAGEILCGNLYSNHGNVASAHTRHMHVKLVYVGHANRTHVSRTRVQLVYVGRAPGQK